jgi:hypothetical protein
MTEGHAASEPPLDDDPVIALYMRDIDVSLLKENLKLSLDGSPVPRNAIDWLVSFAESPGSPKRIQQNEFFTGRDS